MDQAAQTIDRTRRSADIQRAELERKKRDLYKVYNPTNQDQQVILNAAISPEVWTIQAKEEAIVPLYVAEKYFEEMTNKIITSKSDKAVVEENEKRMEKGFAKMDLHTEQMRFESKNLKIMLGKREQIVAILNHGLYKEYGTGNTNTPVDIREQKEAFDPGDVIDLAVPIAAKPEVKAAPAPNPVPPTQSAPEAPTQPVAPVIEEEPDEVEEIKSDN